MDCDVELMDCSEGEPLTDSVQRFEADTVEHECYECHRAIPVGVVHEIVTGHCGGDDVEWRTCMDCYEIAKGLANGGRLYGMLWEDLEDAGGEDGGGSFERFTSGCLLEIKTASAKAYLLERWRKWRFTRGYEQDGARPRSANAQRPNASDSAGRSGNAYDPRV